MQWRLSREHDTIKNAIKNAMENTMETAMENMTQSGMQGTQHTKAQRKARVATSREEFTMAE